MIKIILVIAISVGNLCAMHEPPQSTEERLKSAWGHLQMVIAKADQLGMQGAIELGKARHQIEMLKRSLPTGRGDAIIQALEAANNCRKEEIAESEKTRTQRFLYEFVQPGQDINAPMAKNWGRTPLTHALHIGESLECIQELIKMGAGVNVMDGEGETPLTASKNGDVDNILEILKHNPTIDATNKGHVSMLMSLVGKRQKITTLLPELIRCGLTVDVRDEYETTMLIHAINNFSAFEAAHTLVAARANVNAQDYRGETVLHKLAYLECNLSQSVKLVQALFDRTNADATLTNKNDETALDVLNRRLKELYPHHEFPPWDEAVYQLRRMLFQRMEQQRKTKDKAAIVAP